MLKVPLSLLLIALSLCHGALLHDRESQIISKCLERFGGLTSENAERLERYKSWSDTYEEIPCFTSCYIEQMFDFYSETHGFNHQNVIRYFGAPLHNACRERLTSSNHDSCKLAYNGFHCLVKLEDDPFVVIESMARITTEAKTAMKECLHKFDAYEWNRIKDYAKFPVREPIPCYTLCFLNKLQLFNVRTKQWNSQGIHATLGLPANVTSNPGCMSLRKLRNHNLCHWMYLEFTCFGKVPE